MCSINYFLSSITETHQLAEANEKKNERLRAAFGISDSYVDGSSFDPNHRAKEAATAAVAKQQQEQHSLTKDSSSSRSPSPKRKKKKKDRGRSESRSPSRRERKKSSKKKKHRSESNKRKHREKQSLHMSLFNNDSKQTFPPRSPSPKSKHKSKEKKRKRSTSESASQKDHWDCSFSPDGSSTSDASHSRYSLENQALCFKISKHSPVCKTVQRSPSPSSSAKEKERDKDRKSAWHWGKKSTPSLEHDPKSMHHSPVLNDLFREKCSPSKENRSPSCSSPFANKQSEDGKAKIYLDHKEELTASSSASKAVENKLKKISREDSTPQRSPFPSESGSCSSSSSSSPSPPTKAAPVSCNCSPEGPPKRQDKEKDSTEREKPSSSPEISCSGQKQSKTSQCEPSSTPPSKGSKSRGTRDKSLNTHSRER
ncbi:hypothetical protein E2320_022522 [Naja naja]|nr:hypothetical protein E2320_022522 [Naja naja]